MSDKQLRVNGKVIHGAKEFAFDGCHKIYLIFSDADREEMAGFGYEGGDFMPVSELPRVWEESCPLRFIHRADLTGPDIVPQDENDAEVTYS